MLHSTATCSLYLTAEEFPHRFEGLVGVCQGRVGTHVTLPDPVVRAVEVLLSTTHLNFCGGVRE